MARVYTSATVALAISAPVKWVDNVLSHYPVSEVRQGRQGVARKIGITGVLELAVAKMMSDFLTVPLPTAIRLSRQLLDTGELLLGEHVVVALNRQNQADEVAARLEFAVEAAPLPKRGRPTKTAKRGA